MELPPCPASPNCVSTEATDPRHAVAPFFLLRDDAWPEIRTAVLALPRTKLVEQGENFLRAECRSALAGFVDDLTVELRVAQRTLALRSAARTGYYDFGVNRRRIEKLRRYLAGARNRSLGESAPRTVLEFPPLPRYNFRR